MEVTRREIGTRTFELRADNGYVLGSIERDNGMYLTRLGATGLASPRWFETIEAAEAHVTDAGGALAARWARALSRAIAAGLDPLAMEGEQDSWAVESATRPGVAYSVGGRYATCCTCEAARSGDMVCCHRAAVQAMLGLLPMPAAREAIEVGCPRCHGTGIADTSYGYHGLPAHQRTGRCGLCEGDGIVRVTVALAA